MMLLFCEKYKDSIMYNNKDRSIYIFTGINVLDDFFTVKPNHLVYWHLPAIIIVMRIALRKLKSP
jgi:hypothetical protein